MREKFKKVRCRFSEEWLNTNGRKDDKLRLGWVIGESRTGEQWAVIWDNTKTRCIYHKDFIEMTPLLDLLTEEDNRIKEMTKEENKEKTLNTLEDIQNSLNKINILGLNRHAVTLLIRDYVGVSKITVKQINLILDCLPKIKSHYEA